MMADSPMPQDDTNSIVEACTKWDRENLYKELGKFNMQEVQKIWVCGPPEMNETFDRALTKLIDDGYPLRED